MEDSLVREALFISSPLKLFFQAVGGGFAIRIYFASLPQPSLCLFVIVKFWNLFAEVASGCHFMKLMQVFFCNPLGAIAPRVSIKSEND